MEENDVHIQRGKPGNHKAQAIAERANKTIAERLYSHQYAQEMLMNEGRSRVWESRLRRVTAAINREPRRILANETPTKAVDDAKVKIKGVTYRKPVGLNEVRLPSGVMVRYLLNPEEDEGDNRSRATDPIWSIEMFYIDHTVIIPNQPVLYYLSDGAPRRNFVREELQVIPEDTELPPDHVLKR